MKKKPVIVLITAIVFILLHLRYRKFYLNNNLYENNKYTFSIEFRIQIYTNIVTLKCDIDSSNNLN